MLMKKTHKGEMPDITSHSSSIINSKINWVGMDRIAIPVIVNGEVCLAKADVYVNILDPSAKGIHMSRLFLALEDNLAKKELTLPRLKKTLDHLIESQAGLSDCVQLSLKWEQPISRKALLSDYYGWKSYPMSIQMRKIAGEYKCVTGFSLYYSSTCPCSSALARQLVQKEFKKKFGKSKLHFDEVYNWLGQNQIAAPHSQRSRADIKLLLDCGSALDFLKYIDAIETVLKTPVQTAVKRADEQEFARLNGENLMFVEDALRRMKDTLERFTEVKNFRIKTQHFESLHQHNASGIIAKG